MKAEADAKTMTCATTSAANETSAVVHAFRGKEFVEYDNPYDVGDDRADRVLARGAGRWSTCDALVMLGTDFPYRSSFLRAFQ